MKEACSCPGCGQPAAFPTLAYLIEHAGLTKLEASVLTALWKGQGLPVRTLAVFDAMYVDDPDGGPSQNEMYKHLRLAIAGLRRKLRGWSLSILRTQGWLRLALAEIKEAG